MVKRRHITRGKPAPAPVKKVVRKAVDEDEIDDVEDELDDDEVDVEDELDVDDVDEEEEEPEPAPRRVSRKVIEEEVADEDEEPAPVKKAAKSVAPPAKLAKVEKKAPVPGLPGPAVIKSIDTVVAENVFTQLLEAMEEGKSIVITKVKDNKWQISSGAAVKFAGSKISNTDFWNEVISSEFREWHKKWLAMTYEQKLKYAKKVGAKWEEHADPRTNLMRLMPAVRTKEGITKYKDQYRTRAQRAALRAG